MKIDIGTKVHLGGATGQITQIFDDYVVVEGVYYYSNGSTIPEDDESDSEPYCCYVKKLDLDSCELWFNDIIDGSKLEMKWGISYE